MSLLKRFKKMHTLYSILLTGVIILVLNTKSSAQNNSKFDEILSKSNYNARMVHQTQKYENLELFTGYIFEGYSKTIAGSPYFRTSAFTPTDIVFRGIHYFNIPAKYDAYIQTLIIQHSNGFTELRLENDGIESFTMYRSFFKHYRKGEVSGLLPDIYRHLADGKYTALVKDGIILDEKIAMTIEKEFNQKNYYFVIKDNQAHIIRSKKALIQVLGISSKEYNDIRKSENLKWKKNKESIIQLTTTYKNKL